MSTWTVRTISGYAGGLDRKAKVNLEVIGLSDTVEQVREMVQLVPEMAEALRGVLDTRNQCGQTSTEAVRKARALLSRLEGGEK